MNRYKGKETKRGLFWCNVYIDNKPKLVIAELIDNEKELFKLRSNSSNLDNSWIKDVERNEWYFKEVFESEINEFFTYNY